jgi:hypothetical protein
MTAIMTSPGPLFLTTLSSLVSHLLPFDLFSF